jgi:SAM-dependent methyltransferase
VHGKCIRVPLPLYKYNLSEHNTCYGEKNEKIQEVTHDVHDRYTPAMVEKWCGEKNYEMVDLCSCDNAPEGYIGVDKIKFNNKDLVFDLDEPNWPFKDESVGVFRLQDALEHLKNPLQTMKEIYRCLAPFGWVLIEVPSTDGRGAFQDPTHVSFWNSNSFWYYTKEDQARFIGSPVKFQLNRIANYYPNDFCEEHNILYTKAHLVKLPDDKSIIPAGGREI